MHVAYTSRFIRLFRKLPDEIKREAERKEQIFRHNPFDHRLATHKLKGKLQGLMSFSISYKHRVLFEFIDDQKALFYDIGDHDIYR